MNYSGKQRNLLFDRFSITWFLYWGLNWDGSAVWKISLTLCRAILQIALWTIYKIVLQSVKGNLNYFLELIQKPDGIMGMICNCLIITHFYYEYGGKTAVPRGALP